MKGGLAPPIPTPLPWEGGGGSLVPDPLDPLDPLVVAPSHGCEKEDLVF